MCISKTCVYNKPGKWEKGRTQGLGFEKLRRWWCVILSVGLLADEQVCGEEPKTWKAYMKPMSKDDK